MVKDGERTVLIIGTNRAAAADMLSDETYAGPPYPRLCFDGCFPSAAHRLSTVKNADQIAVITNAGIKEIGTHEQVRKTTRRRTKRPRAPPHAPAATHSSSWLLSRVQLLQKEDGIYRKLVNRQMQGHDLATAFNDIVGKDAKALPEQKDEKTDL